MTKAVVRIGKRKESEKPVRIVMLCDWLNLDIRVKLDHRAACIIAKSLIRVWQNNK